MTHDMNQDEIRRQLRAVDRMNDEAMPKWRALLDRIVGGDPSISTDEKAAAARRAVHHTAHAVQVRRGHDHRRRRPRRLRLGQGHQGDHDRRPGHDRRLATRWPGHDDGARRRRWHPATAPRAPGRCPAPSRTSCSPAPPPRWRSSPSTSTAPPPALLDHPGDQGRGDDVRRPPPAAPGRAERRDHQVRRFGGHRAEQGRVRRAHRRRPSTAAEVRRADAVKARRVCWRRRPRRRTCSPAGRCRPRRCARRS